MQILTGGRIVSDTGLQDDLELVIENGRITSIEPSGSTISPDATVVDLAGDLLLPGFIDVQVNGGGGMLFNDDPSVDCIRKIGEAHRHFGTTGFMPTLISDDLQVVQQGMEAVAQAIEAGVPGVLGIHIEGPFLNPARKGIHDVTRFRRLDDEAIALLASLRHGKCMVTLAPEVAEKGQIERLCRAGVLVSIGHTDATALETVRALAEGATGFTHLFNAMSQMSGRSPGVVGAALADAGSFAGVIVDRFHVDSVSLQAAIRAKGREHIMLVSDAMPSVGMADKNFDLMGTPVSVQGGKAQGPDGTLAGSDLDMATAVRNTRDWLGCSLADAAFMASQAPAVFLGLQESLGSIAIGKSACLLRADENLNIKSSWIGGDIAQH